MWGISRDFIDSFFESQYFKRRVQYIKSICASIFTAAILIITLTWVALKLISFGFFSVLHSAPIYAFGQFCEIICVSTTSAEKEFFTLIGRRVKIEPSKTFLTLSWIWRKLARLVQMISLSSQSGQIHIFHEWSHETLALALFQWKEIVEISGAASVREGHALPSRMKVPLESFLTRTRIRGQFAVARVEIVVRTLSAPLAEVTSVEDRVNIFEATLRRRRRGCRRNRFLQVHSAGSSTLSEMEIGFF